MRPFALALVFTAPVFSQTVPWASGEQLIYQLSWQGMDVGKFYLSAHSTEGGWRFHGRLEPQGLAALVGYGLEEESITGPDHYTNTFWRNLTEPFKGTTKLSFARTPDEGCSATVIQPSGKVSSWHSPVEEVLDELSLIYYARLYPEVRQVNLVDYPGLAQGTLQVNKTPDGTAVYRFVREGLLVEVRYRSDPQRTPTRIIFGRDFGQIEGRLLER
ncbi:DUF3108 domain-containing protein [Meiothermus granaticius]|uniref:DUF3108 domain-containing protein n=1 Tax=Meiothermus granaticius NBRC 107808 TaxID=1227551 RepID=A0A399F6X5_9DEIN|nr:DUF3108 domain-containing protein [Meiothermus granaticius]MCL6528412.1 DUF3108 domain-containing protein [Thermaceae bacterium]RIH90632.1 hypothetical protein Mgrana_03211 [Meiothermus granaticius NBRC 107808]GEM88407.1 hypothetical protein MGR01S_30320 [Meiothermus granaticius NBRC 107808]